MNISYAMELSWVVDHASRGSNQKVLKIFFEYLLFFRINLRCYQVFFVKYFEKQLKI